MAEIIVPNEKLQELRRKLSQAKTVAERTKIADQISALESTIMAEPSGAATVEAAKGGLSPSVATPESFKGRTILSSSMSEGVYSARSYDPITGAPTDLTQTGSKKTYYDAQGNPISPAELAQTSEGKSTAKAGWDIGFGPGKIGPGPTDYVSGYIAPGTTDYNVMMGLDPLTGQPVEEVIAGRAKYTDPKSGKVITTDASGKLVFADSGLPYSGTASSASSEATEAGRSAYNLLLEQFQQYGLGALVEPLKAFITEGLSPAEFTLRLRETDAYKKRFAANQARIQKGLRALSEAEYIGLEDQYQDVLRRYGLPETYYTRGDMGRQEGFEKFIGGDVSPVELEDRIQTAQRRVINANPEVIASLRSYYPEIGNGEVLAYFLDPNKAIEDIRRKVTAAEIGGAATQFGLGAARGRAEELAGYGVTKEQAQQGFQTIADILPRGSQLAEIYKQGPYTQTVAEQEVFGLAGATEAGKQRKKLTQLEQAAFSGQAGAAGGALARDRAGAF